MRPIPSPLRHAHVFLVGCCVKKIERRPSKAFVVFYFCNFFCCSICRPKIRKMPPPYTPPQPRILFIIPPIAATNYWLIVVSYVQTDSHQRPKTRPPLYFLMYLNLASQPRELAMARANPPRGTCNRLVGSRSSMIWGHGRCCHGDIGQSHWR